MPERINYNLDYGEVKINAMIRIMAHIVFAGVILFTLQGTRQQYYFDELAYNVLFANIFEILRYIYGSRFVYILHVKNGEILRIAKTVGNE